MVFCCCDKIDKIVVFWNKSVQITILSYFVVQKLFHNHTQIWAESTCAELKSWWEEWRRLSRVAYMWCAFFENRISRRKNSGFFSLISRTCLMSRTDQLCFGKSGMSGQEVRNLPLTAIVNGPHWWCMTRNGQINYFIERRAWLRGTP